MTSSPVQTPVNQVEALEPRDLDAIQAFLEDDVVRNLFVLSWLDNYGVCAPQNPRLFGFFGVRNQARLVGVALVITGRLAFLDTRTPEAAQALGRHISNRSVDLAHIVSSTECVSPFWEAYRVATWGERRARLDREQELFVVTRTEWMNRCSKRDFKATGLRMGRAVDLDAIFWASAKMHAEETLDDPLERDADHFRRHVEHRLETERTYAWFNDHRRLMFKADISAQSRYGVQISGVYTPVSLRGQGLATRAMHDLCDALFSRGFPRVSLYVNVQNLAAVRVYQKVGFNPHCDYRTVFVETDE